MNCPNKEEWNGMECVCQAEHIRVGSECKMCPPGTLYNVRKGTCYSRCGENQVWNGTTCVCAENYFVINHSCQQCPVG